LDNAQDPASPGTATSGAGAEPAGLRRQIGAVRDAIRRLVAAHVELAKAEAGEIAEQIGRIALLGGIALALLLLVGLLLPIGGILFLGEWIFGSIGWGVLLGSLLLIDGGMVAILVALGTPGGRIGRDLVLAVVLGATVAVLLVVLLAGGRVGVALGLFVTLIAWPALSGYGVARGGIDVGGLKARLYPTQTIETTKETIEWVRERTPRGPKS
jgi:hypothetical protein